MQQHNRTDKGSKLHSCLCSKGLAGTHAAWGHTAKLLLPTAQLQAKPPPPLPPTCRLKSVRSSRPLLTATAWMDVLPGPAGVTSNVTRSPSPSNTTICCAGGVAAAAAGCAPPRSWARGSWQQPTTYTHRDSTTSAQHVQEVNDTQLLLLLMLMMNPDCSTATTTFSRLTKPHSCRPVLTGAPAAAAAVG